MMRAEPGLAAIPWLSVVMPSYNAERWIQAALGSLAAEDTEGVEVLLVDSSPTSQTLDVAREFTGRLQLRLFERRDLSSWHTKTNFAVEAARSAHVCWLGVDDLWLPGRVAAVRRWIDVAPAAPLHLAPSAIVDTRGRTLGVWRCPLPADCELLGSFVIERLLVQNFIAAPAPVFRKDAWLACAGLDEALWYTADWDLWLKLAAMGHAYYHEEVTIGFRVHGESLTATGSRQAHEFARQMQLVLDRHLPALHGDSRHIERAARASIGVNAALAAAMTGNLTGLIGAAWQVLRLGPAGIRRYLRDSRITERVMPRIRAKLSGNL